MIQIPSEIFSGKKNQQGSFPCWFGLLANQPRIPLAYYDNNIAGTVSLLKVMEENNCKTSSSVLLRQFRRSTYSSHLEDFPLSVTKSIWPY